MFSTRGSETLDRGAQVIARTQRGLEAGEVLCEATDDVVAQLNDPGHGQILREMTAEDLNELAHMKGKRRASSRSAQKSSTSSPCRCSWSTSSTCSAASGSSSTTWRRIASTFANWSSLLASEFQTRIEMRQIGVRDEAKLLADYGDCGKPVCCNTHLREMPPVSMKMAKLQKATLDPTKISGRCGRLKCCLRYEYDTYEELQKDLPPIGSEIVTATGRAGCWPRRFWPGNCWWKPKTAAAC